VTAATRRRFADVVRADRVDLGLACLLLAAEADPEVDVDEGLATLDELAAHARQAVPLGAPPPVAARGLQAVLGDRLGFGGRPEDYADLRSSLLPEVLRRRRGLPVLLSVVWAEVCARLDVTAWCTALPGHVVVGLGDAEDEHLVVDPFAGGAPVAAAAGLSPWHPLDVVARVLTNVRVLAERSGPGLEHARTRLWAVELGLLLPRHDADLRRQRGELLVRLGDHLGGAAALEEHAGLVEDVDPGLAERCRRAAAAARARLN
jgi:hypothetical protein